MAGLKILILEDDSTQSEALALAFQRIGHEVFKTDKAEEARAWVKLKKIQMIFVDCLLPGQSGVDFVESIRKTPEGSQLQVVLMSGIFTDSGFVKDALRSTAALAFLKKPFDLKEAIGLIPASGLSLEEKVSPRKALYQTFNRGTVSVREKRKLIEALDEIHGYDLPFIYSLLVESKMSGHLNIVASNGDVSGISFSNGVIVAVDIADQETFLGKLLIESGFILPEDLEEVLNVKSTKKIGERLISGNLLSPHAFNIVLSNQMNIRLSRTIVNSSVRVNFSETDVETSTPHIDSDALVGFLHDWIAGKITMDWLKAHYLQWHHHRLVKGPQFSEEHPAFSLPLVHSLPGFLNAMTSGEALGQILESQKFPEEPFCKALHFLLTKGIVVFGEALTQMKPEDIVKMLKRYLKQFQGKNKVEVFDLMVQITNNSESDAQKIFVDFNKLLNVRATGEVEQLRSQVLKIAEQAYEFVQSGDRDKVRSEMAKTEIEMKIKAAQQFEDAKNALQRSQVQLGYDLITKCLHADPSLGKGKIYLAWAKLGLMEAGTQNFSIKEVEMDLMQASPEDKLDAIYNFVTGLLQRAAGELVMARKSFEKALAMDSTLIVARREINRMINHQNQKKDVLNRDLKDLVSGFFGKKR